MAEPTRDISVEDFIESFDRRYPACILETLLRDRTTGRNIIWADNEYEALGDGYLGDDEITVENQALRHLWWPAHPGPDWAESRERYDIGTRVRTTGGADTDAQAGMPAGPFERSMGPGDAWGGVADAWLEPHEGADEPHAGVARRRGAAVPRPVCGAPRGARDSRERTWRHLDVWQHGTIVRCAVPRADCPGHGARTVRTPWEARPNSHLAATDGRDRGAPARPCAQLEAHGGDAPAVPEVARDMAAPCSLGCAGATPSASQAVDRLHVMRLAPREADRVGRAEAKSSAEGAAARGDQVPPAEEAGEPGGAPGGQEGVAHVGAPARRPRDGRGAPGGPPHARRGPAARGLDRWPGWVAHSNVPQMKGVAATVREERGGILNWLSRRSTNGVMEGMNPAIQPMKRAARGFRGLADFTAPIFLGLGRLEFAATSATGCATH